MVALFGMAISVFGQNSPQATSQATSATTQSGQSGTSDSGSGATANPSNDTDDSQSPGSSAQVTLTSSQIFAILQEKPEVVIELKSVLANALQQQGVSVQADSITDEMLYSQISSSVAVRTDVTTFLRARGYISEADLQRFTPPEEGGNDSSVSLQTLAQIPGSNLLEDGLPGNGANLVPVPGSMANNGKLLPKSAPPSLGAANNANATSRQLMGNMPPILRTHPRAYISQHPIICFLYVTSIPRFPTRHPI